MASASFIQAAPDSTGKKLAASVYTEGGQTVYDEKVILGEQYLPNYTVTASGILVSTANSHLLEIVAGTLNLYIRRIRIYQDTVGTNGSLLIQGIRISTAGTGGTAITPQPMDTGDGASDATAMTLPSSKGTEGVIVGYTTVIPLIAAAPMTNAKDEWIQHERGKAIKILGGGTNGWCLKNTTGVAADALTIVVEFTAASF